MPMIIDQIGLPSGVPGRARRDGLSNGAAVMLTDNTPGGATVFELLWVPDGDISAVSSLEVTTDPRVWTFTPTAGVTGPYRILLRHTGAGQVTEEIRIFGVADENDRVPPAPGERADPTVSLRNAADPALIAKCERNWPTAQFPAGNPLGWYADVIISAGSSSSALRVEADWCLTELPAYETSEDGSHLTGNSESGDLVVDSAPYGNADTAGRFRIGQLVLVPFNGTVEGLYRVNQDSDDGWELEKIPLTLPTNAELEIRIKYGAQWGGCTFLTNQAQLSWGPNFRIRPQPLLPYPLLSEPLTCIETISGGYPHGYQNNMLLVGKLNLVDATLAGGESLLYLLAPSDNPDAILGCGFGVKIVVGNSSPLTIACGSGQTIEAVDGLSDSNTVIVPAVAGTVVQWLMTPGGVWRVLPTQAAESAPAGGGVTLTGNPYIDVFGTPHAADDEFDDGSADFAARDWEVWNITDNVLMTRLGPVGAPDAAGMTSGLYRSSRYGSHLMLQMDTNKTVALLRNLGSTSSPCSVYVRVGLPWGRPRSSGNGSGDSTIADAVGVSPCMALGAPGTNPFAGGTAFRMFLMSDTSVPRFGYTEIGAITTNKFPTGESAAALFQADTFVISTQVGGKLMYFWAIDSTKGSTVLSYQQAFGGEISINSPTKAGVVLFSNSASGGGGGPSRLFMLDYFRFRIGLDWFGL